MKKKGIIALLLFIILCAGAGIFLLLYRQGGGTEQVAAPLPEEEAVVLADNMFYRDVPAEHLVLDEESGMPYVDDELIVAAAEGASWEEVQRPLKKYSPSLAGYNGGTNTYEVRLDGARSEVELLSLAEELTGQGVLEEVRVNYWLEGLSADAYGQSGERGTLAETEVRSDSSNYWLHGDWGIEAVKADVVWKYDYRMEPVAAGVWDFFCDDTSHEDIRFSSVTGEGHGKESHGMHVAGIMGASHNGTGVLGMAPMANIAAENIRGEGVHVNETSATSSTSFEMSAQLSDLIYNKGAKVVNISFGFDRYAAAASLGSTYAQLLMDTINKQQGTDLSRLIRLNKCDFVLCVSSGNLNDRTCREAKKNDSGLDRNVGYVLDDWGKISLKGVADAKWDIYCGIDMKNVTDKIIVVGAMQETGMDSGSYRMTDFSTGGSRVDIAAPGYDIYSLSSGGGYTVMDGTSMAAPYVSGAAACLYSLDSSLTGATVKRLLATSSQEMTLNDGRGNYYHALDMEYVVNRMLRTVTGGVRDKDTGESLSGVQVDVYYDNELRDCFFTRDGIYEGKLLKGQYELKFSLDGYEPVTVDLTIEEGGWTGGKAKILSTVELERGTAPVYLSSPVQKSGLLTYFNVGLNGGGDETLMKGGEIPMNHDTGSFLCTPEASFVQDWNYDHTDTPSQIHAEIGDRSYIIAADSKPHSPLVYREGTVFYFNMDDCLMAVDQTGGQPYCVFRGADRGIIYPDNWQGSTDWLVMADSEYLYFTPQTAKGVLYKMDFTYWNVEEIPVPAMSGWIGDMALIGTEFYFTQSDNSLYRASLDGSGSCEWFREAECMGIESYGGYLCYQQNGEIRKLETASGNEQILQTGCDRIIAITDGRLYYWRWRDDPGFDIAMYYSCLPDGSDEICHGVWSH